MLGLGYIFSLQVSKLSKRLQNFQNDYNHGQRFVKALDTAA